VHREIKENLETTHVRSLEFKPCSSWQRWIDCFDRDAVPAPLLLLNNLNLADAFKTPFGDAGR
jgi:hypothetical protein